MRVNPRIGSSAPASPPKPKLESGQVPDKELDHAKGNVNAVPLIDPSDVAGAGDALSPEPSGWPQAVSGVGSPAPAPAALHPDVGGAYDPDTEDPYELAQKAEKNRKDSPPPFPVEKGTRIAW